MIDWDLEDAVVFGWRTQRESTPPPPRPHPPSDARRTIVQRRRYTSTRRTDFRSRRCQTYHPRSPSRRLRPSQSTHRSRSQRSFSSLSSLFRTHWRCSVWAAYPYQDRRRMEGSARRASSKAMDFVSLSNTLRATVTDDDLQCAMRRSWR